MARSYQTTLGFIGAGKMGEALIGSAVKARIHQPANILAYDIDGPRLEYLRRAYRIRITKDIKRIVAEAPMIILGVKPQTMSDVLDQINPYVLKNQLYISIAAGIPLKVLESRLPAAKVVRVMPNTPCLVGEMAAGYTFGPRCTNVQKKAVRTLLNTAGLAFELSEKYLDAVTALSGSGPAFIAYLIQAMTDAGVKLKLPKEIAYQLSLQTVRGTAMLLDHMNLTPQGLIDMVSSPGGTTLAGRRILENSDTRKVIEKTVAQAYRRSKELGKSTGSKTHKK